MAKITFSQTPKRVYYSYVDDGHIYNITSNRPEIIADNGGYYCCYFECEPYHKEDNKYYRLYKREGENKYVALTVNSFNGGETYFYSTDNGKSYAQHDMTDKYYSKNGLTSFDFPRLSTQLPHVKYDEKTYYFDTLISNGASYDAHEGKFTPMDVKKGEGNTTYGDILLELIENSININNFNEGVNNLPDYLTGGDLETKYTIESINYELPANYLIIFGELFIKKLNTVLKQNAETIINIYNKDEIATTYKNAKVETKIAEDGVGIVTTTPLS